MSSQIDGINHYMPSKLSKTTEAYEAIFGDSDFTEDDDITESSDFNCGAIANELEYVNGFLDYITRTQSIDDFYGTYLTKIVKFFTGIERVAETDAVLRKKFKALCIRNNNQSWITKWMILDAFSYFADSDNTYIVENYILDDDDLVTDGSFEDDPDTNWTSSESGSSTITYATSNMFYGTTCAKFDVDSSGSTCSISQTLSDVASGNYMLHFAILDDQTLTSGDFAKVIIQRSGDSYYYDFSSNSWSSTEAYLSIEVGSSDYYKLKQAFIKMPSSAGTQDLTLTIENIGSTTTAYTFYVDRVQFGVCLTYPRLKVVMVDDSSGSGYMSLFPGDADPVDDTYDYADAASYLEQDYVSGYGSDETTTYFYTLLQTIKPAGVKGIIEVLWRSYEDSSTKKKHKILNMKLDDTVKEME